MGLKTYVTIVYFGTFIAFYVKHGIIYNVVPSGQEIIQQENSLEVINVWGCRFITTKHRDDFRRIVKAENYDLSIR